MSETLKEKFLEVMNLGMELRQKQLQGHDTRSGNEVFEEWFENTFHHNEKLTSDDYVIIDPKLWGLGNDEIAVGITNTVKYNRTCYGEVYMVKNGTLSCFDEIAHDGNKYKRRGTTNIPDEFDGKVCSVGIYELVK